MSSLIHRVLPCIINSELSSTNFRRKSSEKYHGSCHRISLFSNFPCRTGIHSSSSFLSGTNSSIAGKSLNLIRPKASSPMSSSVTSFLVLVSAAASENYASQTQRIMESLPSSLNESESEGAGGKSSYEALKALDRVWYNVRNMKTGSAAGPPPSFVERLPGNALPLEGVRPSSSSSSSSSEESFEGENVTSPFDVVVCGGTLGIFIATSLALKGKKVAIVEKGKLKGRSQEWNISRKELDELVDNGILTQEQCEQVISISFNPNRCGFYNGKDIWVRDILNLGISPLRLLDIVKQNFLNLGGRIFEETAFVNLKVYDDIAVVNVANRKPLFARLVIDAMGNFSPIVRQIRWGQKPDGICLVVGSCAKNFEKNDFSDIIYTNSDIECIGSSPSQYFWEAFPAGSGASHRTTYMFSYMDCHPERPSLEQLMEEYWRLMPPYQGVKLEDLEFLRILFGFFPTYRNSPLPSAYDRVIQVGDASGIQSPLSFGGFGSITRHLKRISNAIDEALDHDFLNKGDLSLINAYQPNLSSAWLFQKAMSSQIPPEAFEKEKGVSKAEAEELIVQRDFINRLLSSNFQSMEKLGDAVLRPFLQDVTQFQPLALTLGFMMISRPQIIPSIISRVGILALVDWLSHFSALSSYTVLSLYLTPQIKPWLEDFSAKDSFVWKRRIEAWEFGSGLDYHV